MYRWKNINYSNDDSTVRRLRISTYILYQKNYRPIKEVKIMTGLTVESCLKLYVWKSLIVTFICKIKCLLISAFVSVTVFSGFQGSSVTFSFYPCKVKGNINNANIDLSTEKTKTKW